MGTLPFLSVLARRRFNVAPQSDNLEEVERSTTSPLMVPLLPKSVFLLKMLSPMAKLDAIGRPSQAWKYELPPMEVTGMLVNQYHINAVAERGKFPYSMKAVGLVNAHDIMNNRGKKGLVSDNLVIVP